MALAALIAAVRDAEDGSGLVGTLLVAGRSLLERQARLAARAGAGHVVILVERVPAPLTAAIDRLRRDGITVEVARSAGDAADRFHPEERVLVIADGALVEAPAMARIAACPAPALLTLGEGGPAGPFERIDAATRWAGVILVSGEMLRRTVAMLGDWDLHSTLLRRAVGSSARRLDVADGAGLGEVPPVMLVRTRAGARQATQASFALDRSGEGWATRLVYGPIARLAVGGLLERPIESVQLRWGAIALSLLAAPALGQGWIAAGLALLVGGGLLDAIGRLLATLRLVETRAGARIGLGRSAAAGLGLIGFAAHCARMDAAAPVLGLATVAAMAAKAREAGLLARFRLGVRPPPWVADADALVLLSVPFALVLESRLGLSVLALYAAASFAAVQHRLAAPGVAAEPGA